MPNEKVFAEGLIFKMPANNAPDFVKGRLSVKVEEFIKFLKENEDNDWVNIDLLVSRNGKPYAALNDWKPPQQTDQKPVETAPAPVLVGDFEDEMPF